MLGIQQASVALYAPLLLPLGLELGGFIFLALGLAPRRREPAKSDEKVAQRVDDFPTPIAKTAKPAAKSSGGTKSYYQQRLERDFPEIAKRVANGELSVYKASIAAGLRKAPAKRKWDANEYAEPVSVTA